MARGFAELDLGELEEAVEVRRTREVLSLADGFKRPENTIMAITVFRGCDLHGAVASSELIFRKVVRVGASVFYGC